MTENPTKFEIRQRKKRLAAAQQKPLPEDVDQEGTVEEETSDVSSNEPQENEHQENEHEVERPARSRIAGLADAARERWALVSIACILFGLLLEAGWIRSVDRKVDATNAKVDRAVVSQAESIDRLATAAEAALAAQKAMNDRLLATLAARDAKLQQAAYVPPSPPKEEKPVQRRRWYYLWLW